MGRKRAGRIAAVVVAVALLGTTIAAFLLRDRLIESWHVHVLRTGEDEARIAAAEMLGEMRAHGAAPALAHVAGEAPAVREAALAALGEIPDTGPRELATLVQESIADMELQRAASQALLASELPVSDVAAAIVGAHARSPSFALLYTLQELLSKRRDLGEDEISVVMRTLMSSSSVEVRQAAIESLAVVGVDPAAKLPIMLEALDDLAPGVREGAIRYLGSERDPGGLARVVAALDDASADVRRVAADALRNYALDVVEHLGRPIQVGEIDLLGGGDPFAGMPDAKGLMVAAELRRAVPHLLRALEDSDSSVALLAIDALAVVDSASLRDVLRSGPARLAPAALRHLVNSGLPADDEFLLEAVESALHAAAPEDADGEFVRSVFEAFHQRAEPPRQEAKLLALVELACASEHAVLREAGLHGVIGYRSRAAGALDRLIAILEGDGPLRERQLAIVAMRALEKASAPAIPALLSSLADADLAGFAADALASIGEAAIPALVEALGDDDEVVRLAAIESLSFAGSAAQPAEPAIVRALDDPSAAVRRRALESLRTLRSLDAETLSYPGLVRLLEDDDISVRFRAASIFIETSGERREAALDILAGLARDATFQAGDRVQAVREIAKGGDFAAAALAGVAAVDEKAVAAVALTCLRELPAVPEAVLESLRRLEQASEGQASFQRDVRQTIEHLSAAGERAPEPAGDPLGEDRGFR